MHASSVSVPRPPPEVEPGNDEDGTPKELPEAAAQKKSSAVVCCPCTHLHATVMGLSAKPYQAPATKQLLSSAW